jgi:hypothetical protein
VLVTQGRRGRHRAPKPARHGLAIGLILVLVAVLGLGGAVVWMMLPDVASPVPVTTDLPTQTSPSNRTANLSSSRIVRLKGQRVTVEETIAARDGDVTIAPAVAKPAAGLRRESVVVSAANGKNRNFAEPTSLVAGGSITVTGRYRLTDCPDVLPTRWPIPTTVVPGDWSRTLVFSESPQRTAGSLCPEARTNAKRLPGLSGALRPGDRPVVRLTWRGSGPLTVRTVGSASGVAVLARAGKCGGDCLARIPRGRKAQLRIQALEPCPVGGKSNLMTLIVDRRGATRVAEVKVSNLGKRLCSSAAR